MLNSKKRKLEAAKCAFSVRIQWSFENGKSCLCAHPTGLSDSAQALLLLLFGCTPPSWLLNMAIIGVILSLKSGECQILLFVLQSTCESSNLSHFGGGSAAPEACLPLTDGKGCLINRCYFKVSYPSPSCYLMHISMQGIQAAFKIKNLWHVLWASSHWHQPYHLKVWTIQGK